MVSTNEKNVMVDQKKKTSPTSSELIDKNIKAAEIPIKELKADKEKSSNLRTSLNKLPVKEHIKFAIKLVGLDYLIKYEIQPIINEIQNTNASIKYKASFEGKTLKFNDDEKILKSLEEDYQEKITSLPNLIQEKLSKMEAELEFWTNKKTESLDNK